MQGRKALWPDPNNYIINRNQGGQEKKRSRQPYSQKSACVGYLPRRRCPIRIPRCRAFCRRAPAVRFIDFEMAFTGVLLFECLLSSLSSCLVQTRRTTRFAVLAISSSPSKFIGLCKFLQAPQSRQFPVANRLKLMKRESMTGEGHYVHASQEGSI